MFVHPDLQQFLVLELKAWINSCYKSISLFSLIGENEEVQSMWWGLKVNLDVMATCFR